QGLHEPKAFTRRDILLLVPSKGQDTLPDNDFKLPLFLVPVPNIPAVNAHSDGTVGNWQSTPVARASLDERPLLVLQLCLTPLGHRQRVAPDRGHTERLIDREKVLQRLYG